MTFNKETLNYKNYKFTCWDIGGPDRIRPLWRYYFQDTQAVIFVIDSGDRERIDEAAEEFNKLMREDELRDAVALVFANKQDLPNAMTVQEVTDKLDLCALRFRKWHVQPSCGVNGDGLHEGLDWLSSNV